MIAALAVLSFASVAFAAGNTEARSAFPPFLLFVLPALACLLLNVLFTMAQTVTAAVGPFTLEKLKEDKDFLARFLERFLSRLPELESRFAAAALLMLLCLCFLMTKAGMVLIPEFKTAGAFLGISLALVAHVMLVEVFARNVALADPPEMAKRMIPLAQALTLPLLPLIWIGMATMPRRRGHKHPAAVGDMHLRLLPSLSGVERVLEEETYELIDSVRDFAELHAVDIMTPRTQVEGVPRSLPPLELYERLRKTEFSRLVVYDKTMDNVSGVLLVKEILLRRPEDPFSLLRQPIFASEDTRLPDLLAMIRQHRTHLVVVEDEFGGMSGIVTLHDLFETIVGHIEDIEDEEELWIEELDDGTFRLNGRVEIWEVNEELGLTLDEDSARTIGGFVFHTLGRVAREGDVMELPGLRFEVERMQDNRIGVVRLAITGPATVGARQGSGTP